MGEQRQGAHECPYPRTGTITLRRHGIQQMDTNSAAVALCSCCYAVSSARLLPLPPTFIYAVQKFRMLRTSYSVMLVPRYENNYMSYWRKFYSQERGAGSELMRLRPLS
eukprot:4897333-Pleurochrysis_carterae.AAC.1